MKGEQYLLLPGPTPVPDRVARAMNRAMINHRGPEFQEILVSVTEGVKKVYGTESKLLIYPSSGTGAMEAAVVNFLSPGDNVLAVSIGVFGDRFAQIAEEFGAQVEKMDFPWGEAADPEKIKERLEQDKNHEIKAVLLTHNETSTGVSNDVKAIKEAAGDHPALFIVDAVSGLSVVELKMDEWGIDVVVSGSQKAFMMPPGLSFLGFNDKAMTAYENNSNCKFYWDIGAGLEYLEKGQNPFTPAISLYYGLEEALKMMFEEGLEEILQRHNNYRRMVRAAIREMGLKTLAADGCASPALTSVIAPEGIGANKIRKMMQEEFDIVLAGGQKTLDDVIFRLGHLGYVRQLDLISVLAGLETVLFKAGYHIELGSGVKKAQEFLIDMHE
jgi:aspartate aminotransferase-like enzyme